MNGLQKPLCLPPSQLPSHPQTRKDHNHNAHIMTHRHAHWVFAFLPFATPHKSAFPSLHSVNSRCARTQGAQSYLVSQSLSPQRESETPPVCLSACISIAKTITLCLTTGQPESLSDGFPSWSWDDVERHLYTTKIPLSALFLLTVRKPLPVT